MGLTNDERNSLVKLRMDKAKRLLDEAEQMYSMQLWDMTANRIYYALLSCSTSVTCLLWFVSTYSYWNIRRFWNELCKNK